MSPREHYSVELVHMLFSEELKPEMIATSYQVTWGKGVVAGTLGEEREAL